MIYGGDGGVSRIDPVNASNVYVEYVHGALAKSTDGGETFANAVNGITESSANFMFIAPYVFDPNDSLRLYTGGAQLWRTENGMGSWTAASAPIPQVSGAVDSVTAIAVSPVNPNLVVFGSHYGKIFRSASTLFADGTTVWPFSQPRLGNVSYLEFDPENPNTVYATYATFNSVPTDQHVYRSTDAGITSVSYTHLDVYKRQVKVHGRSGHLYFRVLLSLARSAREMPLSMPGNFGRPWREVGAVCVLHGGVFAQ